MNNDMSISLLNYYFEFQEKFKPVKDYQNPKDIVIEALKTLAGIIKYHNDDTFLSGIKLVYLNYFMENTEGQFDPIFDELIYISKNEISDGDMKNRILQHMSFYIASSAKEFIRISKSLLVHNKSYVSDFFIKKTKDADGYLVYLNGNYEVTNRTINATDVFPITPNEKYYGDTSFEPYDGSGNDNNGLYLFTSPQRLQNSSEQVACKEPVITEDNFCAVFERPLSSHFVMLENASLLYVYSKTAQIGKNDYLGYGGIFILLPNGLTTDKINAYKSFFQLISDNISICVAYNIMRVKQIKETVRSAIAQVMARNMSHNYGSHVFSHLINDGVYEKMVDLAIEDIKKYHSSEQFDKELFKDKNTKNHQLQYFFQYLKSRMDYLSEVTFCPPNMLTTKMMYGDVMKGLDQVRILLNYISGVSDFKYQFELKHNGELLKDKDIGVAFPSDMLGCHAFYNIIENIIRNTAKHARKKNNNEKPIVFTINFKEIEGRDGIEGANGLYCVEIDNGIEEDSLDDIINGKEEDEKGEKVKGLIDRINDSVLDNDNKNLRSHSLGLLEMEASAAFLRQIDLPEIESDDYVVSKDESYYYERNGKKRLNIIKPFKTNDGHLGYRFFVQKPKEFLFVGNWGVADAKKNELLNFGIQFISANRFMTDLERERAFAHQFLIYDSSLCEEVVKKLKKARDISFEELYKIKKQLRSYNTLLPLRKLKISEEEKESISSYWSGKKQDNASYEETKQIECLDCVGKSLLQKLKEFVWERYFKKVIEKELDATGKEKGITLCNDFRSNNKSQVDFLDHSYESKVTDYGSRKRFRKKHEVFVENLTSRTQEKLPRFSELSKYYEGAKPAERYINHIENEKITYLKQEIFEAYHNKVVILDERVQKFAEENSEGSANHGQKLIPCWRLFGSTNIDLPRRPKKDERGNIIPVKDWDGTDFSQEKVFSIDPNDFDKNNKEMVENYVNSRLNNAIILIHYGVLERMYKGEESLINNTLEAWADKAKRVVVTSGRGAHSLNLPESVCFVNLSPVLYACIENRNKYLINYLLNQSRRKNG